MGDFAKDKDVPDKNVGDTIYRQSAIDALDKMFDGVPMELTTEILELRRELRVRIPSAQQERKKGKWIDKPVYIQTFDGKTWDGCTYCSECREMRHEYGYRSKYCPNCGAEMTN